MKHIEITDFQQIIEYRYSKSIVSRHLTHKSENGRITLAELHFAEHLNKTNEVHYCTLLNWRAANRLDDSLESLKDEIKEDLFSMPHPILICDRDSPQFESSLREYCSMRAIKNFNHHLVKDCVINIPDHEG
ncbi:MAG: hypothetical protein ABJH98_17910 [Reichenbachiella sp.]|uniref:hypothetical protein n=1 Tax=Reichenbachiella sp. TaxID=2184521 RepID=UPI003299BD11